MLCLQGATRKKSMLGNRTNRCWTAPAHKRSISFPHMFLTVRGIFLLETAPHSALLCLWGISCGIGSGKGKTAGTEASEVVPQIKGKDVMVVSSHGLMSSSSGMHCLCRCHMKVQLPMPRQFSLQNQLAWRGDGDGVSLLEWTMNRFHAHAASPPEST